MYDFDKTLSVKDMQEYSFIPSLNMTAKDFWTQSDELAYQNEMDYILSYMLLTVQKAKADGVDVSRNALKKHGENVQFNKGVEDWFDRINAYGDSLGLEVKHYVISCGLKPMIEGTKIGDKFTNIFAFNVKINIIFVNSMFNSNITFHLFSKIYQEIFNSFN